MCDFPSGHELTWINGSHDDAENLLRLLLWSWYPAFRGAEAVDPYELTMLTGIDGEPCHVDNWDLPPALDALITLIDSAFVMMKPRICAAGHTWVYNDGALNDRSGYLLVPQCFYLEVDPPSFRERQAAWVSLQKLCAELDPNDGHHIIKGFLNARHGDT